MKKLGVFMTEKYEKKIKQQNRKTKWKYYNKAVFYICNLLGSLIALYVGGWMMLIHMLWITYMDFCIGRLTILKLVLTAVCVLFSTTVAGGIWCLFYMLGRKLERKPYGRELL